MIIIKTKDQLKKMEKAGAIVRDALNLAEEKIKAGMSTEELDSIIKRYIEKCGAYPSFLGYGGFPKSACISIDSQVVHGIPNKKTIIRSGNIVSVDVGAYIDGFHGDAARTFIVGEVDEKVKKLVKVTEECFFKGIEQMQENKRIGDIAFAIQSHAESNGFSVVRELVGHGIGEHLHEDPQVPNFGRAGHGARIQNGMVLAIEPMINMGGLQVDFLSDGWTVRTRDGLPSAHYENTLALIDGERKIFTL